jgi:two-component system sensor histidine kinase EvgS
MRLWLRVVFVLCSLLLCSEPLQAQQLKLFPRSTALIQLEQSDAEQGLLMSKKQLVFGTLNDEHPPFVIKTNGKDFEGITADYLGLISAALSLPVEIRSFATKADLIAAARAGVIDFYSYARMNDLDVADLVATEPYADDIPVLVSTAHQQAVVRVKANNKPKLAFSKHYLTIERLQQSFPDALLMPYDNLTQAIEAVALGHADLYLGNVISAHYLIHSGHFSELNISNFTPLASGYFNFYVSKQQPELLTLLNKVISAVPHTEQQQILQRWSAGRALYMVADRIDLSEAEQLYIERDKPVRLVHIAGDTPFFMGSKDLTQGVGILKSLTEAISAKTGLEFEWVPARSLTEMLQLLKDGKADLSGILSPNEERKEFLHFSRPYLVTSYALLTRSHAASSPLRLEQMAGKTLAIQNDHAIEPYLKATYPNLKLKYVENLQQSVEAVLTGQADAMVENLVIARFYAEQTYKNQLRISSSFMPSGARFTLAVSKQQPELYSILDKTLLSIPPDQLAQLSEWSVNTAAPNFWQSYRQQFIQAAAAFVLIVLVFLFWNFYLRRQVRERQLLLEQVELAKEQALEASKAKSFFLSTMSHEIRTPLQAIIGTLELAKRQADERLWDFKAIDIAYDSAQGLKELIGDILDIAKIEAGQLELNPQWLQLQDETKRLYQVFVGMAKSKGLYLNYKMDLAFEQYQVALDPLLFKQLLSNLLSNAIKFTPAGGVDLNLMVLEQQEEHLLVQLLIKDTGQGLTAEQSEKVLKPFTQLANSERVSGERGSGLGLSICQTIVQLMQGRLSIVSEIGRGTEIQIKLRLPCKAVVLIEPDKKLSEEKVGENQQHQSLKLLVVDDHQVNRMLLQRQLSYLGHQVWQAADGREALQLLKQQQLDLVLTDCTMPLMDGYQLALAIRADQALQNLVVLGLTARAQSDEIARCIAAGMNDCLFKPISINELQQSIQKYAKGKAAFNVDALCALAGPDPAFARQMLSTLCQSNSADIEQLKLLLQQSDWDELKRLAHKIKGAAVLVQAEQLIDSCEILERATEQEITSASLRVLAALKVFNREAQLWCHNSQKELASDEEN